MKPIQDGRPVIAYSYWDFEELMAGWKSFTDVTMQHVTSSDLIGPITAYYPVTGANNMAIAAQVPIKIDPATADEDVHYVYVIIAQGVERRCELIDTAHSKHLGAKWINNIYDRTDQTVPLSATEQRSIKVLKTVVGQAASLACWQRIKRERERRRGSRNHSRSSDDSIKRSSSS